MRILLVHRYFWPDVPTYAQMLRFIGEHLHAEGNEVSVFCGPVTYNGVYDGAPRPRIETLNGVRVHRISLPPDRKNRPVLRAVSLLVFAFRLIVHVVRNRSEYDLFTVTTIPPIVMGVAARIVRRITGIPYLYHCMDLYPEVAEVSGMARNPWVVRLARKLDSSSCRNAAAVIVLSDDMRITLSRRGIETSNVVVLNNFEVLDDAEKMSSPAFFAGVDEKVRILFAGNMGRFQGLEDLVKVAHDLVEELPFLEFVFMGAGANLMALKDQAGDLVGRSVRFIEHQTVAAAADIMRQCEIGLVSLRARVHEVAYPSKTAMYLTAGCRILAIVEADSALAQLIRDEDLGATCAPGDLVTLAQAIRAEAMRGGPTNDERRRNRAIGEREFGRQNKLAEWSNLLVTIGAQDA